MRAVYLISMLLLIEGCSIKEVKPWEKGTLAKDILKPICGTLGFS